MRYCISRATLRNMKQNLLARRIYLQQHWYPRWRRYSPVTFTGTLLNPVVARRGNGAVFHYRR